MADDVLEFHPGVFGGEEAPTNQPETVTKPQDTGKLEYSPSYFGELQPIPKTYTLPEAALSAAKNVVPSAGGVIASTVHPFLPWNWKETAEGIGEVGKGLYSKAEGVFINQDPEEKAKREAAVNAVGKEFASRYGGWENVKKTFAEDPASIAADAATVLTLGGAGAARAPGLVGKMGAAAKTFGEAIDPITGLAKGIGAGADILGKTAAVPLWMKTGTSFRSLDDAAKAGATSNPAFWEHFYGKGTPQEVASTLQSGLSKMAKERSDAYVAGMSPIKGVMDPLDMTPVVQAYKKAHDDLSSYGTRIDQPGTSTRRAMDMAGQVIMDWVQKPRVPGAFSMADFDGLKRSLDIVRHEFSNDPVAVRHLTDMRNAAKDIVTAKDPNYARVMEQYAHASDELNSAFATVGTHKQDAIAKVRRTLKARDDAMKGTLIDRLTELEPNLPFMLAGQELRQTFPQGLRGTLANAAIYGTAATMLNPAFLAGAAMSSPKIAGTAQYGIGRLGAIPSQIEQKIPTVARGAGYMANTLTAPQRSPELMARKTGGRVYKKPMSDVLIDQIEKAKKEFQRETNGLLRHDDETIVKALKVANEGI